VPGDAIKDLLTEQGNINLVEIQAQLTERGAPVCTVPLTDRPHSLALSVGQPDRAAPTEHE
jgi:hypothetical protein